MKILCITPWFPAYREDQQGNFILDSIESLIELGHELTVLVPQPWRPRVAGLISKKWKRKKIQIEQYSNKINLHYCRYFSIPRAYFCSFSFWSFRRNINPILENLIAKYQCQIIHAHTELAGISAIDVGKKLGIPTVVTLHGISTEKKLYVGKTRKLLFEYTLSNADRVILVGKPLLQFSKNFVNNLEHFRIVGNGFRLYENTFNYHEKKGFTNPVNFISVSNLEEGKGINLNLHALAKLKKNGITNWIYKIVGDGSEKKNLMKLAAELNLTDQVFFLGACDHTKVYQHLMQSDIFILPSYREAFGVAYLEAMSCGLLTVGVRGQGPAAFIEDMRTGLLIEPNNIDALADILQYIFLDPNKMFEIATNGKQYVCSYFTWKVHAKNLEKVYQEVI